MKVVIDGNYGNAEYDSILQAMEYERVFSIERDKDNGMFLLREACDDYFSVAVNKEQLIQLGREIIEFAENAI